MTLNAAIITHVELLIGSIGIIIGFFWGLFLFYNKKQQPKATLFFAVYLLALSLKIGKAIFLNYFYINPKILNIFLSMLLLVGPSIWWYTKQTLAPHKEENFKKFIHYLPALLFTTFCWIIPNDGTPLAGFIHKILLLHMLIYTIYTLVWIKKQPTFEDLSRKSILKNWLTYLVILTLILIVFLYLVMGGIISYYMGSSFLFSFIVLLLAFKAVQNPIIFRLEKEKYVGSNLDGKELSVYSQKLNQLMLEEKPYLNSSLTLNTLAQKLEMNSKQLSQVINQNFKQNYSQYITQYRIEEAKKLLVDPSTQHYKIAAIAYDCGFNSLSSFNTAFKKYATMTASEYRNSLK